MKCQVKSKNLEINSQGSHSASIHLACGLGAEGFFLDMKSPCINFYTDNFLSATMFWTHEQVGAYCRLLFCQHQHGHLSIDQIIQLNISGELWEFLKKKFIQDEKGLWYNLRMDKEVVKKQKYQESRLKNLKTQNEPHMDSPYGQPICEIETETEYELSEYLSNKIKEISEGYTPPSNFKRWAKAVDLMIRLDKRTPDQIRQKIDDVFDNDFWSGVIRSMDKLRDHWKKGKLDNLKGKEFVHKPKTIEDLM